MPSREKPFTQAFNFVSAALGTVDPRTGVFMSKFPLEVIKGNNLRGPELALVLSYSPLCMGNPYGLGQGITLGFSEYDDDRNQRSLSLSTGESYKVAPLPNTGRLKLKQSKLDTVHIYCDDKPGSKKQYKIKHKNGITETLSPFFGVTTRNVLKRIENSDGLGLNIKWTRKGELESITDDTGVKLFEIKYITPHSIALTAYPDSANHQEKKVITLKLAGYDELLYLKTITCQWDNSAPSSAQPLVWTMDYTDKDVVSLFSGNRLLNSIVSPTGGVEEVDYRKLINYTEDIKVGAVYTHTLKPGAGQPIVKTFYEYSPTHFLHGSTPGQSVDKDGDLSYLRSDKLTYWTRQKDPLDEEGREVRITWTYNIYHQLISEKHVVTRGPDILTCSTTTTEYPIKPNTLFDDQPVTMMLPVSHSARWEAGEKQRQEITSAKYDNVGNPICQTASDGTVTFTDYYPAAGVEGKCPPDAEGFIRFIRAQTVFPPFSANRNDEFPVRTEYIYSAFTTPSSSAPKLSVVQHFTGKPANDVVIQNIKKGRYTPVPGSHEDFIWQKLSETESVYQAKIADTAFGQLLSRKSTFYGENKSYVSREEYHYSAPSLGYLTIGRTLTTFDGLSLSSTSEISSLTGRVLSKTDAAGNKVQYQYDSLGRLTETTVHPDKAAYTEKETYTYSLPVKENKEKKISAQPAMTIHTDRSHNETRVSYDGVGREILCELRDQDADDKQTWHPVSKTEWDAFGRIKTTTVTDRIPVIKGSKISSDVRTTSYSSSTEWDDWGQPYRVTDSHGLVRYSVSDPLALTQTQWITDKEGKYQSARNVTILEPKTHRPVRNERRVSHQGSLTTYSSVTQIWDSMGRLREATDELGHTTFWEYDVHGRTVVSTYPDKSKITKTYVPFSGAGLITGISVKPANSAVMVLGTQEFDGLGRLKRTDSGGRTSTFIYEHAWQTTPHSQTGPDGVTSTYIQDPRLGGAVTSVTSKDITQTFDYDLSRGQLKKSFEGSEKHTCTTYSPYRSGRLQTERVVLLEGPAVDTTWSYSLAGLPVMVNADGVSETRGYQSTGRLERITDDAVEVLLKYDALGRLYHWEATERVTKASMVTELTFDDLGREEMRKMTHTNGTVRSIGQTWKKNNQLAQRHHYGKDVHTAVLNETFEYDNRNRLNIYTCSGTELPSDPYGNKFVKQIFDFDVLNNITVCRTVLSDGSINEARYFFENKADPCQLTGLTNGVPERVKELSLPPASSKKTNRNYPEVTVLTYDSAGRMVRDEEGRTLTYDALGRLATIKGGSYSYDAHNRMVYQKVDKTQAAHRLFYRANRLIAEWVTEGDRKPDASKDSRVRLIYAAGGCVAQAEQNATKTEIKLTGTDAKHSVVTVTEGDKTDSRIYTPYGYTPTDKD